MNSHRRTAWGVVLYSTSRLNAERGNLERAAETIEDWLEAHDPDDSNVVDDADDLRQVGILARAGAPEEELNRAVKLARERGWSWAPIALLLGETREQARQRLV
jgi:hypothetical protein